MPMNKLRNLIYNVEFHLVRVYLHDIEKNKVDLYGYELLCLKLSISKSRFQYRKDIIIVSK